MIPTIALYAASTSNSTPASTSSPNSSARPSLDALRERIERVDAGIIELIAERHQLARDIGAYKRANAQPILDPGREVAVVNRAAQLAREAGLPDDEIRTLFWRLIALARRAQLDLPPE